MNQQKIGEFLKELRKQKGLTQEQFAEIVNVSNRTISRWENGNNLPDLDILIEISDYYEIDLRELLDGERKGENMNKEMEETVLKAVEYENDKAKAHLKWMNIIMIAALICWMVSTVIRHTQLSQIGVLNTVSDFTEGVTCGLMICGLVITLLNAKRLREYKQRMMKRK